MKKLFQLLSVGAMWALMTSAAFCGEQLPPDGTGVPDGGATLGLLAVAVVGLVGFACRRAK